MGNTIVKVTSNKSMYHFSSLLNDKKIWPLLCSSDDKMIKLHSQELHKKFTVKNTKRSVKNYTKICNIRYHLWYNTIKPWFQVTPYYPELTVITSVFSLHFRKLLLIHSCTAIRYCSILVLGLFNTYGWMSSA